MYSYPSNITFAMQIGSALAKRIRAGACAMSVRHTAPEQNPFDRGARPGSFVAAIPPSLWQNLTFRMPSLSDLLSPWRRRLASALALSMALLATPNLAQAHHSFAMYDQTKIVTLSGTVKDFQWSNPHALVWLLVPASAGDPVLWSIELPTGPGNLTRMGWSKHSLNPGDKVAIDINPLRDGRNGGSLKKVQLVENGKVLIVGPVGGPAVSVKP